MTLTCHKLVLSIVLMAVTVSALSGCASALGNVTSCDKDGNPKDVFGPGENVYVKADGLESKKCYAIWIQYHPVNHSDRLTIEEIPAVPRTAITDADGNISARMIWHGVPEGTPITYDIVVHKSWAICPLTYNSTTDGLDNTTIMGDLGGFIAPIPELPAFALAGIGAIVGLIALGRRKD